MHRGIREDIKGVISGLIDKNETPSFISKAVKVWCEQNDSLDWCPSKAQIYAAIRSEKTKRFGDLPHQHGTVFNDEHNKNLKEFVTKSFDETSEFQFTSGFPVRGAPGAPPGARP